MQPTAVLMATLLAIVVDKSFGAKLPAVSTPLDSVEEIDQGDPFQYSYNVAVDVNSTRVEQSKAESSNGQEVVGQYKVLLPDGRLQTVTYTSGPNGYKATVHYVQVGQDGTTESSGRSFTSARISSKTTTLAPTTTTTRTTTTSTPSSPITTDETSSVNVQQNKDVEAIDGRTSTSSRSRQRSNRTRGERIRSPADSSATFTRDDQRTPAAVPLVDNLRKTVGDRSSSGRPGHLKSTWQFDRDGQLPDDIFNLDYDDNDDDF